MSSNSGIVGADGKSATPHGIHDMSGLSLDAQIEEKLQQLLDAVNDPEDLDNLKAKFKLEVAFTEDRSFKKPYAGLVSAWTNGGFAHGGGDEVVYLCPTQTGPETLCNTPLHIAFVSKRVAVCPECKQAHDPKDLTGQVFARLTMQNWAKLLTRMFRVLEHNADIRIGVLHGDLRQAAFSEIAKQQHGDRLAKVRHSREWLIYPLKNIVKDTSTGSELEARIRAFLQA